MSNKKISKLDQEFIEKMKKKLLKEKQRLENELKTFAKVNKNNSEDFETEFPNFGDTTDENSAEVAVYSDNLSLEKTLEKSLRDVKDALKRIKLGTYGICKYCGETILKKRLEARPESGSCMKCKVKLKGG